MNATLALPATATANGIQSVQQFLSQADKNRLDTYSYYEKLLMGEHFEAFRMKISSEDFNKEYSKLRYVKINFAGLLSKIMADMLFSEPVKIKVPDGDQAWVDAFVHENKLNTLFYESELTNSALGDEIFKLRAGKRYGYPDEKNTVIVDSVPATVYFPEIDKLNVTAEPQVKKLACQFKFNGKEYVKIDTYLSKKITTEFYLLENNILKQKVTPAEVGMPDVKEEEEIKIKESLIIHIPNWKTTRRYFGISDYYDLDSLFFAINNRMTKIDNILDKHSDPILAVPEGILDKEGKVKRENIGMVEIPDAVSGNGNSKSVPQYIVWNASLENAFKEVEKLVEFLFMVSETSPDILGMGQGQADSGRALKYKLLRTIAKTQRKKLYYDQAIKDLIYRAQLLAYEYGYTAGDLKLTKKPVMPELEWMDGIPDDETERVDIESKRLADGTTTRKASIMRIDKVDEDIAEKTVEDIDEETKVPAIGTNFDGNPFSKKTDPKTDPNADPNNPDDKNKGGKAGGN